MCENKKCKTIFALICILSVNCVLSANAQVTTQIQTLELPTSLIVNYDLTRIDKNLKPGDLGTLVIVFQNNGGLPAKEVEAWISYTKPLGVSGRWYLGTINPGSSVTTTAMIKVADDTRAGSHLIYMDLKYKAYSYDDRGVLELDDEKSKWSIPVTVYGDTNLVMGDISSIAAGKTSNLEINLKNLGSSDIKNLIASLSTEKDIVPVLSRVHLDGLAANRNETLIFRVHVPDSSNAGTYPASLQVSYEDGTNTKHEVRLDTGITVISGSIRLVNVEISPGEIEPGKEIDVDITIKNVGDSPVNELDVKLSLSELPFTPIGSGTNVYIEKLDPQKEKTISFRLISDDNSEPKPYMIPLDIDYSGNSAVRRESVRDSVGVILKGKSMLDIAKKSTTPERITANEPFTLTIKIQNSGTSDAKGVTARLESNLEGDKIAYLGKIGRDDYANAIFTLTSKVVGDTNIKMKIAYEDDYGKNELERDITLVLYPATGQTPLLIILIALPIILALIWRLRKKLR